MTEAELIARILVLEKSQEQKPTPPAPAKPAWQRFLESNGGAAFVTVLIGGVFGTLLSNNFQNRQQEREQKMKLYTLSLNEQSKVSSSSMELLGETVHAASSLAETRGDAFVFDPSDAVAYKAVSDQIKEIKLKFNAASELWSKKGLSQGFILGLNSSNHLLIEQKWRTIAKKVDEFLEYVHNMEMGEYNKKEVDQYILEISNLTSNLIASLRAEQQQLWDELN